MDKAKIKTGKANARYNSPPFAHEHLLELLFVVSETHVQDNSMGLLS